MGVCCSRGAVDGRYPMDHPRGWLVVFGALLIQLVVFGLVQSFPVFHKLMHHDDTLGRLNKEELSLVSSIAGSVGLWIGWIWGYIGDQFGPRPLLLISSILVGLCTLLPPFVAHSANGLLWCYAVPLTLAAGIANSPLASTVGTWFEKYLTTALGVSAIGGGIGTLTIPIITALIAEKTGSWRLGFIFLSSLTVVALFSAVLMKPRLPVAETRGDLDERVVAKNGRFIALLSQIWEDLKVGSRLCCSRAFIMMSIAGIAFGYSFFTILYVTVVIAQELGKHGTPYADAEEVSIAKASSLLFIFGVAQCVGSFGWGGLGHCLPSKWTAALVYLSSAATVYYLSGAHSFKELALGMGVAGFTMNGGWILFPALMVEHFNSSNLLGLMMGLAYGTIGIGAALGPYLTTVITVNPKLGNQDYTLALQCIAGLMAFGAVVIAIGLPKPKPLVFEENDFGNVGADGTTKVKRRRGFVSTPLSTPSSMMVIARAREDQGLTPSTFVAARKTTGLVPGGGSNSGTPGAESPLFPSNPVSVKPSYGSMDYLEHSHH